jgi:mono/diheme cytochrome c family protein
VPSHGHAIFAHSCAGCHTLAGRESGANGGDLANTHLTIPDLVSFAKIMPARTPLSPADALAVGEYIHTVATGHGVAPQTGPP